MYSKHSEHCFSSILQILSSILLVELANAIRYEKIIRIIKIGKEIKLSVYRCYSILLKTQENQ